MTELTARPEPRRNPLRWWVWGGAAGLLLLPLIAMQFTREVDWDGADFAVMAVMLAVLCGLYELGAWLGGAPAYRAGMGMAAGTGFLVVWVNLAVGMIGSEDNPYNLNFGLVLLIGLVGALLARFRPRGMALALVAAAALQALVAGIALVAGWDPQGAILSSGFVVPWLSAAWLFHVSANPQLSHAQQKLKVHGLLSLLLVGLGGLLLVLMVVVESEPGLVPLVMITVGVAWFLATRYRNRRLAP